VLGVITLPSRLIERLGFDAPPIQPLTVLGLGAAGTLANDVLAGSAEIEEAEVEKLAITLLTVVSSSPKISPRQSGTKFFNRKLLKLNISCSFT
jgi:hypothetical protein